MVIRQQRAYSSLSWLRVGISSADRSAPSLWRRSASAWPAMAAAETELRKTTTILAGEVDKQGAVGEVDGEVEEAPAEGEEGGTEEEVGGEEEGEPPHEEQRLAAGGEPEEDRRRHREQQRQEDQPRRPGVALPLRLLRLPQLPQLVEEAAAEEEEVVAGVRLPGRRCFSPIPAPVSVDDEARLLAQVRVLDLGGVIGDGGDRRFGHLTGRA